MLSKMPRKIICDERRLPPVNYESEREEGEIIDDADDISDISSEEEFLLRQRLLVLENYNNVLERKEKKRSCVSVGTIKNASSNTYLQDLAEIAKNTCDERLIVKTFCNKKAFKKSNIKYYKKKQPENLQKHVKPSDTKKRRHKVKIKKKAESKFVSRLTDSDSESDYEYRNKRRKLANAVTVPLKKLDSTSLKARLMKMFNSDTSQENKIEDVMPLKQTSFHSEEIVKESEITLVDKLSENDIKEIKTTDKQNDHIVDLCRHDDSPTIVNNEKIEEVITSGHENTNVLHKPDDSDEDLESLRQRVLQSKQTVKKTHIGPNPHYEDEDSDTSELRLICLRSAILKRAIEMKQEEKLKKRLSQSSNFEEVIISEDQEHNPSLHQSENNTDIESVDMEIGVSDGPDGDNKDKETLEDYSYGHDSEIEERSYNPDIQSFTDNLNTKCQREDDIEEDEDLLRAKLLTSLSHNLPKLIKTDCSNTTTNNNSSTTANKEKSNVSVSTFSTVNDSKRFIINTGDSDSGSDPEATKNLTKMHVKLSEQVDFQKRLDIFLKSARMQVESKTLPDLIQKPQNQIYQKPPKKFIPKALNHLPKSEQLEYRNLVKRMSELQKVKEARQISGNVDSEVSLGNIIRKETPKPKNVSIGPTVTTKTSNQIGYLDKFIGESRKKIAHESSKMLRLKEEGIKLAQKYKIVATELRNLRTAMTLNKREQQATQMSLSKMRSHHQVLVDRSLSTLHSKNNFQFHSKNRVNNIETDMSKDQKENGPVKDSLKNADSLKFLKVSIVNDLQDNDVTPDEKLSVQIDTNSNRKTVSLLKDKTSHTDVNTTLLREKQNFEPRKPKDNQVAKIYGTEATDEATKKLLNCIKSSSRDDNQSLSKDLVARHSISNVPSQICTTKDDYQSPLQAMGTASWSEDPHAVLCPFEVAGSCKDRECKFLHPKVQ